METAISAEDFNHFWGKAMCQEKFIWLHLSDMHFGQDRNYNQQPIFDKILKDAEAMAKKIGSPDMVMVTGDLAYSANKDTEYPKAIAWLKKLLRRIGANKEQLFLVPGNHDVNRGVVQDTPASQLIHENLRQQPKTIDDFLNHSESLKIIWPKLSAYADNEFIKSCAAPQLTAEQPYWCCQKDTALGQIVVVGLNTVLLSYDDNDGPSNLALGKKQLFDTIEKQKDDTLLLVLQHHPPQCLLDGNDLEKILRNRPHILFSGHTHQQGGDICWHFDDSTVVRFNAGAGHVNSDIPPEHSYAWGQLSARGIKYFPRIWNNNRSEFVADRNSYKKMGGDESVAFNVDHNLPGVLSKWLSRSKKKTTSKQRPRSTSNDKSLSNNLPSKPGLFIGRDEELQKIVNCLTGCPANICIYGEPGIGKTTLALRAVWSLYEESEYGVIYFREYPHNFNEVLNCIARYFSENSIVSLPYQDPNEKLQKLLKVKQLLRSHSILLYFDGLKCPEWIDELQDLAGCCCLLITSRRNEQSYWLDCMKLEKFDCESSIMLFEKHYKKLLSEQDKKNVKEIVQFLDHLPLAIELAACRAGAGMSLQTLLERLSPRRDALDLLLVGRRSMKDTINLSYQDLPDQSKQFFRMLSVFDGRSFSMEAVEAIWDSDNDNEKAFRHLNRLIDLSLVKSDNNELSRYALHPVIQAFAQKKLQECGVADKHTDRMIDYFLDYTEKNRSSFTNLEWERENILAMMKECDKRSYCQKYLRFADALLKPQPGHYAYGFLAQKGFWQEALEIVQRSLELTTDPSETAKFHEHLGLFHYWLGEHDKAMEAYDKAEDLYEQHNDFVGKSIILQRKGFIVSDEGEYQKAEDLYRESLKIAERNSLSEEQLATATHLVGVILYHQCRYEESREYLEKALGMRKNESNADVAVSVTQRRLAGTYRKLRKFTETEDLLENCLSIEEEMGNERNIARCFRQLGLLYLAQDKTEEARSWLEKSYNIFHKIGNKQGIAGALTNLGEINVKLGNFKQAESQLNESLSMSKELRSRFGKAMNLRWLAQISYQQEDYSTAINSAREALTYFEQIDYVHVDELCALLNKSLLKQSLKQTNNYPSLDTYKGNEAEKIKTKFKEIWKKARPSLLDNDPTIDANLLDLENDDRRGVSLIARLSEGTTKLLTRMQDQLKAVAPEQHYYKPAEYHITIVTFISADQQLQLNTQQQERYVQILSRILDSHRPFRVHFRGISATNDSIIVLGFFKDGTLDSIRRDIRAEASALGLEGKIDSRYVNISAHVTFVRFRSKANIKELAEEIERWQHCDFGVCPINKLELVTNDWYMTTGKVKVLKTFKLLPSA